MNNLAVCRQEIVASLGTRQCKTPRVSGVFLVLCDKLEFIALALTAPMASPGGKLSSEARLMRNGELYRLPMQFVKKVLFLSLYLPI